MMTKVSWSKLPVPLALMLILCVNLYAGPPNPKEVDESNSRSLNAHEMHLAEEVSDILVECQNDIVVTITDPINCDTTVYFQPPTVTGGCPITGVVTQVSGPIPDSAAGAGDGTPVTPGSYVVEYQYTDVDTTITCSINVTVNAFYTGVMSCKNLNVSVDEYCEIAITPFMLLTGEDYNCETHYMVLIHDSYGNVVGTPDGNNGVILGAESLYQELSVTVQVVGGTNACWSTIYVEDKFPPQIICPTDPIITTCNGLDDIVIPITDDNCNGTAELVLIDEIFEDIECDPDYVAKVTRTYIARDGNGAESEPCTIMIYLLRIDFSAIEYPADITPFTGSGISCDETYPVDENGNPHPCPETGSGTGIPTIGGSPLKPGAVIGQYCNGYVEYTDQVLSHGCTTKVMRTWRVREWHCLGEFMDSHVQIIEIVDEEGPIMTPIPDLTASTTYECEGTLLLPPVVATDICSEVVSVDIDYPGGYLEDSNGGVVNLPLGHNIVTYIAYDACYNSSTMDVHVYVADNTSPVTVCEINTVVSLPSDGNIEVWAETFDDGSHDECGIYEIVVRRMETTCDLDDIEFDDSVSFCCDDIGKDIQVVMRAYDHDGNYNECMVIARVQDKIVPQLTCPPDMTIYCDDNYDLNNPNFFFGEPIISDNCATPDNVEQEFLNDVNSCNTGILEREIRIRDEFGTIITSCIQEITILPTNPFDFASIIWPEDYEADGCDTQHMEPGDLEDPYSFPTVFENECDLIGYNWDDEIFEAVPGQDACYKIIRHWTLINWCEVIDDEFTTYTYDQVLVVNNMIDPEITCSPVTIESIDISCDDVFVDITVQGFDDCTMDLNYYWSLDLNSDGSNEHAGNGPNIQGDYPIGNHTILWTVSDLCGNENTCSQPLNLINAKTPVAVCLNGLSVDLNPMDLDGDGQIDNEMVVLWASDFDKDSYHPCGNEVVVSFSADTEDIYLELDCDDIGIYFVDLWVTDITTGLTAICQSFVDVQDNNGVDFCSGDDGLRVSVQGKVMTEEEVPVENVEVKLTNTALNPDSTDNLGEYAFPNMPTGGAYEVLPTKDTDYTNGVTTLDVVQIQRHILGIDELTSPYKLIAADVNDNGAISGIDLVQVRKLILGIIDEFPSVDSWRFIDAAHGFTNPQEPWNSIYPENYLIDSLMTDMQIDFVAVKMGDVNNSANTNMLVSNDTEERSAMTFNYDLNNIAGSQVIDIYASDTYSIAGLQFGLEFGNDFEVEEVIGAQWQIGADQYVIRNNQLVLSYDDAYANTVDTSTPLFSIKGQGNARGIKFSGSEITQELYDQDLATHSMRLEQVVEKVSRVSKPTPNPWSDVTNIDLTVGKTEDATVKVYDLSGQLLNTINIPLKAGVNTITLTHTDITRYGTMVLRIQSDSIDQTLRVIHLK